MHKSIKTWMYLAMLVILMSGFLSACGSPAPVSSIPTAKPSQPPVTPAPLDKQSTIKVDVLYFHRPQRCPSCLCFEECIKYVIDKDFKNELSIGKLTFAVLDVTVPENAALVKKYGAVGTQLFINVSRNGADTIKDIQEIWDWGCLKSKDAFDKKVKDLIDQSLKGQI